MAVPGTVVRNIERRPEFAGLLKETESFSAGSGEGASDAVNGWYDRLLRQSGIQTPPGVWLGLCVVLGLAFAGPLQVFLERPLVSAVGGVLGLFLPIVLALTLRSRRQAAILKQLPPAAEELSRLARSGRNLQQSFLLVAADTPIPLGDELRLSARRMEMGLEPAEATRDLVDRTGVTALTMLSSAIAVNQETGGDLIVVLERLATSVRDRLHFSSRQRAATIASRLGAFMMVVVSVGVVIFYTVRDPNYLDSLFSSYWGRLSFWAAVVLQVVGGLLVYRILGRTAKF
ncbi:MAG: type II secretion system F family protein [Planctomycetaceae bacterium]